MFMRIKCNVYIELLGPFCASFWQACGAAPWCQWKGVNLCIGQPWHALSACWPLWQAPKLVLQDCRLGSSALCMSAALRAAQHANAVVSGAENSLLIRIDHVPRQAFVEVLASNEVFSAPMEEAYKKLDIDPSSVTTLDAYLSEYYSQILKKLKEVGAQVRSVSFS